MDRIVIKQKININMKVKKYIAILFIALSSCLSSCSDDSEEEKTNLVYFNTETFKELVSLIGLSPEEAKNVCSATYMGTAEENGKKEPVS